MPRFFINVFNDIDVPDEEGHDCPDLAAAREQAVKGAREMMADHVRVGRPITLHHRMEVTDDAGTVLVTIPFREVITIVE